MMVERDVIASCELSSELRAWLRDRASTSAGAVQASALAYELAAVIARHAPSVGAAIEVVDQMADNMRGQIRRLGVWVDHP